MLNAGFASINISGQWHEFKMKVDANHPRVIVLRRLRCYNRSMRTLVATLTALMLFATTPVAADDCGPGSRCFSDFEKGYSAYVEGDFEKAIPFLKRALEQGHEPSGKILELIPGAGNTWQAAYNGGDYRKAIRLLKPLAEKGDFFAQFSLAEMYRKGEGTPEDDVTAAHWYGKSAMQGFRMAQNRLALMYANGEGVPENNVVAYALFSIVAAQGSSGAEKNKKIVAQRLTRAQIAAGQKLSSEFWEKYVVPFQ